MSRRVGQTTKAPSHGATRLSPYDVGHNYNRLKKQSNLNQKNRSNAKSTIQAHVKDRGSDLSSDESTSVAEETRSDGNDSDDAQADNANGDDHDPDVRAPSDCTMEMHGHQTGQCQNTPEAQTPGEKVDQSYNADDAIRALKKERPETGDTSTDDEAYNAVDQISDSEKDGSDMDIYEERAIIDSTNVLSQHLQSPMIPGRSHYFMKDLPSEASEDTWEGFDFGDSHLNHDQDFFGQDQDFFREQFERTDMSDFFVDPDHTDTTPLRGAGVNFSENMDIQIPPPQRRVRFADPILLSDKSATTLAPVPNGDCGIQAPSALKSLTDFDLSGSQREQGTVVGDGSEDESGSSSGYETDYGETTDEDDFPASATARPQALVRRSSTSQLSSNTSKPSQSPGKHLSQRVGPRIGTWCIDPTKPLAILDSCGKRILVCPARRPKKPDKVFEHILGSVTTSANTSPGIRSARPVKPVESEVDQSEASSQGLVSPLFGTMPALDSNLGRSGLGGSDLYAVGSTDENDLLYDNMFNDDQDEDDDDDPEAGIKLEDLIDFGDDAEDSETDLILENSRPSSSCFAKLDVTGIGPSSSQTFLDHLDNTSVTAFRQTQRPAPASLSPLSPMKKRKLQTPARGVAKRRLIA